MIDADYRKWLGPDWKPKWEGSGTLVSNHVSGLMDILSMMWLFFPAFVSKKSVQKYIGVGSIATAMDCIFLNRAGTS